MIKFIFSSFFIFAQNYNKKILHLNSVKYKTISDENVTENIFNTNYTSGCDLRYKIFNIDNQTEIFNIKKNFKYKSILSYLENENNSLYSKYNLLEENDLINDTLNSDIFKGGLLDDWNYNF